MGNSMNAWLQRMHSQLYSELDSLKTGHPSNRDNGRWIAETQGKLDACTLLKDTPIDTLRIDEVRRTLDSNPSSDIERRHLDHYKMGIAYLLDACTKKLNDGTNHLIR